MNDFLKLTIQVILTTLFLNLVNYSQRKLPEHAQQKPHKRGLRILSRVVVVAIFLIAVASLGFYAVFAVEEAPWKRGVGGLLALLLLAYLIQLIRAYGKA